MSTRQLTARPARILPRIRIRASGHRQNEDLFSNITHTYTRVILS